MARYKIIDDASQINTALPPVQQPNALMDAGRFAGGLGARALETLGSFGTDIAELPSRALSYLSGGAIPSKEERRLAEEKVLQGLQGQGQPTPERGFTHEFPSREDLREQTKKLTGETFEPKSEFERKAQEFTEDFTDLLSTSLIPGASGKKLLPLVKRAGLTSLVGQIGKETAKSFGLSEGKSNAVKAGSMVLSGILGSRSDLKKLVTEKYGEAGKAAEGATHTAKNLEGELEKYLARFNNPNPDLPGNWQQVVKNQADQIYNKVQGGKLSIPEAITAKQELGQVIYGNYKTPKEAKPILKKMYSGLKDFINDYASSNKSFGKPWQEAEEVFGAMQSGDLLSAVINKSDALKPLMQNKLVQYAFNGLPGAAATLGLGAGALKLAPKLASPELVAGAVGANEIYKLGSLLTKSPTARKYYADALVSAAKENIPAATRNIKNFSKEVEKFESKPVGKKFQIIE